MERDRMLAIAKARETCDLCADCGEGNVCVKCEQVEGISLYELREYHAAVRDALCRVDEYDKLRAEKRLVVLPCQIGRTVYIIDGKKINRCITENTLLRNGLMARVIGTNMDIRYVVYAEDVGKAVFLTRGEAEAALRGVVTSE